MSHNTQSIDQHAARLPEAQLPGPRNLMRNVTSPTLIVHAQEEYKHGDFNRHSVDGTIQNAQIVESPNKSANLQTTASDTKQTSHWAKVKAKKKYGFLWTKKESGEAESNAVEDVTAQYEIPRPETSKTEKQGQDSAYSSVRSTSDKDKSLSGTGNQEEAPQRRRGSVFKSMPFKGLTHSHQKAEHEPSAEVPSSHKQNQLEIASFSQESTAKPVPISKKQTPTPEYTAKPVPISKKQTPTPEDKPEQKSSPSEGSHERVAQTTGNIPNTHNHLSTPHSNSSLGQSRNRSPSPLLSQNEQQAKDAPEYRSIGKKSAPQIHIEVDGEPFQSSDSGDDSDNIRVDEEVVLLKERKSTVQLLEDQRKYIQDAVISQMTDLSKEISDAEQSILLMKDTIGMAEQNSDKLKKVQDLLPRLSNAMSALERQQQEIKARVSGIERNLDSAIQLNQMAVKASEANIKKVDEVMTILEKRLDKLFGYVQTATTQGSNSTIGYTILGWIFGLFSYILNGASMLKSFFQQSKKKSENQNSKKGEIANDYLSDEANPYKAPNFIQTMQPTRTDSPSARKKSIIFEHPLMSGSLGDLSPGRKFKSPTQETEKHLESESRPLIDNLQRVRHSSFTKTSKLGVEGDS